MTIDMLIFGPAAAAAGRDRVRIVMPDNGVTAGAVLRAAADQHPALRALAAGGGARVAVNHEFASSDVPVVAGDEVALIAMVSGG